MEKRIIIGTLLITSFLISGCNPKKEDNTSKVDGTLQERLEKIKAITDVKKLSSGSSFKSVYSFRFEQYIDHNNKSLGTFKQQVELGFNGFDVPNVYVSTGYTMFYENNSNYDTNENEIAFLLKCNYVFVEHRYFDDSLPVDINYNDTNTWQYLTTEQAAADAHEIVTQLKRALDGKWVSTGASKGGMTTELYSYYYPEDMDLYVPYVAPFCNSFADTRMIKFINEEAGNVQYGETKAAQMRADILSFQIKMLEWRDTLAPTFYEYGLSQGANYSSYLTQDNLYDSCVLEFSIGFWQYYQDYTTLKKCLAMEETTSSQLANKQTACLNYFIGITSPQDVSINNEFTPYYIQAYQELGNYGYDFSYIRNALPEGVSLTVTPEEESMLMWKLVLNESQLALPRKELMYSKINNMLATTTKPFVIIYGSSDPWYAVRPDDVDRENISIYVNTKHPHGANISNFGSKVQREILTKIKTALGVE
ncbi:MAG: hypothetical protein J5511_00080 [Bacilli bacterium]|nr:hypothetical protein [Bacilli bacterium]